MTELYQLSAVESLRRLHAGETSALELAQALLARVDEVDSDVQAWAYLDRAGLLEQAESADARRARGVPVGALSGLPVGIKDIIDTRMMPTEDGTPLHAGRVPHQDAALVRQLKRAGALVMGKTVTTELAAYAPGKTRNPHNFSHTPGGSSSGSAAAVAAGMVAVAVGTQTNGSVIRPAAFCGVVGFKPSFGLIARTGVLRQSPVLDQIGVFGRSVEDVALLAQVLAGDDDGDPSTRVQPAPPLLRIAGEDPPLPPRLAFVRTPFWSRMDADAQAAFEELVDFLGERISEVALPAQAEAAVDWHRTIMEADIAVSFHEDYERGAAQLSDSLRGQIERGRLIRAVDYRQAVERIPTLRAHFDEMLGEYDAILTPAALGTAPTGLDSTGDPVMCTLWTLTGMPAISLPLLHGENGLPLGVQLVGRLDDDARLLRCANWLQRTVAQASTQ